MDGSESATGVRRTTGMAIGVRGAIATAIITVTGMAIGEGMRPERALVHQTDHRTMITSIATGKTV